MIVAPIRCWVALIYLTGSVSGSLLSFIPSPFSSTVATPSVLTLVFFGIIVIFNGVMLLLTILSHSNPPRDHHSSGAGSLAL